MINYATANPPGWLADPVRSWLALAVLVLLLVVFALRPDRSSAGESGPAALPRFGPAPASLRPPALERPMRGREAELTQLRGLRRSPAGRFAVICGVGGMGKTALAAQFASEAAGAGCAVFWIRYRSGLELGGRLEEVAVATGLPLERLARAQHSNADVAGLVWEHLDRVSGWVVVLDNLDQPADIAPAGEPLREYRGWVRPSVGGLLVVTSRDRHPDAWGPAAVRIQLDPLTDLEGAGMLRDAAPQAGTVEQAAALSARLGGLPLALRAAGAVLAEPTSRYRTIPTYQQALLDRTTSILPPRPDVADPEVVKTLVGYTWDLSLDQLAATGTVYATAVLQVLSQFADAPILRALLTPGLLTTVKGAPATWDAVDAAVAGLHRYCLIDAPDSGQTRALPTVALHPVVRETTAARLDRDYRTRRFRRAADQALTSAARDATQAGRGGWDTAQLLAPHLPTLHDLTRTGRPFDRARTILNDLAQALADGGRQSSELGLRQAVHNADQRALGPDHPRTLASRNNLANALWSIGRYQEAADLHRETLIASERILGPHHPDTQNDRNNLAAALGNLGRYREAADLHSETLIARERLVGPDHPDTLASRGNLANTLQNLGRYREAADLHSETLIARERLVGPDHPDTLISRSNLATALRDLGRYQEAADLNRDTSTAFERLLGPDHPYTLASRSNLANTFQDLGRYQEAADLHREAHASYERTLGPNHPHTLTSCGNLASALQKLGRHREVAVLFHDTLNTRERLLGPDHPDTLNSRNNLATALHNLGRYQEAADLHRDTLTARERILGPNHPHTLASRSNLANALNAHRVLLQWWRWP